MGALGLKADLPTTIELAVKHGFGGVDPDLGYLSELGDLGAVTEFGASVAERGLRWGIAGLPIGVTEPGPQFAEQLAALPDKLAILQAAGVTSVGTWIRPMHDDLPYRRNWTLHVSRLSLIAELLGEAGIRLGLEYIGPKTFWSTERFPFIHSLGEALELIVEVSAPNIGLIMDSYHWYTAGEDADDLAGLSDADIVSADINDARDDRERDEQQDLDRRLPGSTGVIDLAGFMGGLRDAEYDGPVKVEPFMKSLADQPLDDVLADVSARIASAIG